MRRVVLLIYFGDSTLISASAAYRHLTRRGFRCIYGRYASSRRKVHRPAVSRRQLEHRPGPLRDLLVTPRDLECHHFMAAVDVVYCAKPPAQLIGCLSRAHLRERASRRPIMVFGFPGIDFTPLDGITRRLGADIVVLNSPAHRDELIQSAPWLFDGPFAYFNRADYVVGSPLFWSQPEQPRRPTYANSIVFFAQATSPEKLANRAKTAEFLVHYARRWPDRRVVCKLRHTETENRNHDHLERYPYSDLLVRSAGRDFPDNLIISADPLQEMLADYDRFITVNSTAILEAAAYGRRFAIISDFMNDPDETLVSKTHDFLSASSAMASFSDLASDKWPEPSHDWIERNLAEKGAEEALVAKIHNLLARQATAGRALPIPYVHYARHKGARGNTQKLVHGTLTALLKGNVNPTDPDALVHLLQGIARHAWAKLNPRSGARRESKA